MKSLFIGYLTAVATLAVLDALWLGVVSRDFYKAWLGQLLLDQPNWPVAPPTISPTFCAAGQWR